MAAPAVCLASCVAASEYLMVLLLLCKYLSIWNSLKGRSMLK